MPTAPLTLGIEEEYQIIDPETRELTSYVQEMLGLGKVTLGNQLKAEFMQSQIEVGSNICRNVKEARQEIVRLRRTVSEVASQAGKKIVAASTHPFSRWQDQEISEGARYDDLASEMKDAARRLLIFGMHIHLGFGKTLEAYDLIIDVLNQMRYFLPHIVENDLVVGFRVYRYDPLLRLFLSWGYNRLVRLLFRPRAKAAFPTLAELPTGAWIVVTS